jgi:hypothetical protein
MLMLPGEIHHLAHLRLGYFICEYSAFAHAMIVNVKHDPRGALTILLEEPLEDVNYEFHRGVVVIQEQYAVEVRFLGLGFRARDYGGATVAFPVPFATLLHLDRPSDHLLSFLKSFGQRISSQRKNFDCPTEYPNP